MLRGSVWMCGLPAAWTSPCDRSRRLGTSSFFTKSAAAKLPGWPGCTFALPDCCSSTGSQPISSSAPVQTTRSAFRVRAIRLGLAWIWCGSCKALVATDTSTRLPPSCCASAPHSGSQAKTCSAACAGMDSSASGAPSRVRNRNRWFMICSEGRSVAVRAVRAQAHLVLKEQLVVGHALTRLIARELQADARELARAEVEHHRVLARLVVARREEAGVDAVVRRPRGEPLGAQADPPVRHELVDALHIPAGLHGAVVAELIDVVDVVGQIAAARAVQVFALQLEVGPRRIAVRRPLPDRVGDPDAGAAAERIVDDVARRIARHQALVGRPRAQHR